jgi:hypothetical protein
VSTDSITWKWTPYGNYSTRSAYRIQFKGSVAKFPRDHIWKAQTENKCKVFTWILIHGKILTANNLQKKEDGRISNTVFYAMDPWRPVFTYAYVALSQRRFGTKFSLGSTLMVYWASNRKTHYRLCLGERRPLAKRLRLIERGSMA